MHTLLWVLLKDENKKDIIDLEYGVENEIRDLVGDIFDYSKIADIEWGENVRVMNVGEDYKEVISLLKEFKRRQLSIAESYIKSAFKGMKSKEITPKTLKLFRDKNRHRGYSVLMAMKSLLGYPSLDMEILDTVWNCEGDIDNIIGYIETEDKKEFLWLVPMDVHY